MLVGVLQASAVTTSNSWLAYAMLVVAVGFNWVATPVFWATTAEARSESKVRAGVKPLVIRCYCAVSSASVRTVTLALGYHLGGVRPGQRAGTHLRC
jgi:hypothetical protein